MSSAETRLFLSLVYTSHQSHIPPLHMHGPFTCGSTPYFYTPLGAWKLFYCSYNIMLRYGKFYGKVEGLDETKSIFIRGTHCLSKINLGIEHQTFLASDPNSLFRCLLLPLRKQPVKMTKVLSGGPSTVELFPISIFVLEQRAKHFALAEVFSRIFCQA